MIHMSRQCVGLWLLASSLAVVTTGVSSLEDPSELYQRAEYHARKYEEIISELATFQNSHIHKRSTNTQNRCSDLVRTVQLMCPSYKPGMGGTTTIPTTTGSMADIANEKRTPTDFELHDLDSSTLPAVMLSKVIAKRIGENVEVEFFINHSCPAIVQRYMSFDNEKKFLSSPTTDDKFISSRLSFSFDASLCWYDGVENERVIIEPVDNKYYFLQAELDICKFDKSLDELSNGTDVWKTKTNLGQPISQFFEVPKLKILSDHGDTILIERGKNISFEAEIIIDSDDELTVIAQLWDWESHRLLTDWMELEMKYNNKLDIDLDKSGEGNNFLSVDVLDEAVLNIGEDNDHDKDDDKDDDKHDDDDDDDETVYAKVRVTVNMGSGELSGSLIFRYEQKERNWRNPPIIDDVSNSRLIALKLPYKISTLPHNTAKMDAEDVQCDKDGNRNGYKYGKNCTIRCYAWGSNIRSIFMVKSHPYRPPVKSSSSLLGDTFAYIIQDLGPASQSQDNDGIYKCTIVFQNGETKTKNIRLVTSRFTKVTNFTLEYVSDSTSRLVCTALGSPNLDMRILGNSRSNYTRERLDDKTGSLRSVESFENNTTVLTLLIQNEHLQYPRDDVFCYALGDGGSDYMVVRPDDILDNYNPFLPSLSHENSNVMKSRKDETITVYCEANAGGKPLEVMVAYGGKGREFRIDKDPGNVREKLVNADGSIRVTLTVPTRSLGNPTSWLYCGAENEFGDAWLEFYLPDYGVY